MAGPSTEGLAVSAAITAELWPGGFKKLKGGPGLEQTYTVRARPLMEWPAGGPCVELWGQAGHKWVIGDRHGKARQFFVDLIRMKDEDMNHSIIDAQTNRF
jgi:hypothetical protein